jgi:hypothetical protein
MSGSSSKPLRRCDPRFRLGKKQDQKPSDVTGLRGGPAEGEDPALLDRGHLGQVEGDRSARTEVGNRLEQPIGVFGLDRADQPQCSGSKSFHLHPVIVGRSATRAKLVSKQPAQPSAPSAGRGPGAIQRFEPCSR